MDKYIKSIDRGSMFMFSESVCLKFIKTGKYNFVTEQEYRNYMIKLQIAPAPLLNILK